MSPRTRLFPTSGTTRFANPFECGRWDGSPTISSKVESSANGRSPFFTITMTIVQGLKQCGIDLSRVKMSCGSAKPRYAVADDLAGNSSQDDIDRLCPDENMQISPFDGNGWRHVGSVIWQIAMHSLGEAKRGWRHRLFHKVALFSALPLRLLHLRASMSAFTTVAKSGFRFSIAALRPSRNSGFDIASA
jgi:hypothetical protein